MMNAPQRLTSIYQKKKKKQKTNKRELQIKAKEIKNLLPKHHKVQIKAMIDHFIPQY